MERSAVKVAKDFLREVSENNWDIHANKIKIVKSLNTLETGSGKSRFFNLWLNG